MTAIRLFAGEDILSAQCDESGSILAKAELFLQSGLWDEVVRGMTDLTVRYDPLKLSGEEAEAHFRRLWELPVAAVGQSAQALALDATFAPADAPDLETVSVRLGIAPDNLPRWLSERQYLVTMMGFQPGFGYLEDCEAANLPTLTRLDTPRQRVAAGSIGFLGGRACIYALDGPGGWPIIGRVREPLFRRDNPQPFLLSPGQKLRFRPA